MPYRARQTNWECGCQGCGHGDLSGNPEKERKYGEKEKASSPSCGR